MAVVITWHESIQNDIDAIKNLVSEQNKMLSRQNAILGDRNNIANAYVPYQKCPKCDGQGITSRPPGMAADVLQWASTSAAHLCDVCNGAKVIPMFPMKKEQ